MPTRDTALPDGLQDGLAVLSSLQADRSNGTCKGKVSVAGLLGVMGMLAGMDNERYAGAMSSGWE